MQREKRVGGDWIKKHCHCFSHVPDNVSDTLVTSSSHKCNPLCYTMFLFTFQECGVVRGVLIHCVVLFVLTISPVSLCLSLLSFLPFTTLSSIKPPIPPTPPSPLTHFLLSKEEEPDYLTPPVWASHLPIFLPVDHQPTRLVMEGEICRSTSPLSTFSSSYPSQQHAWFCTLQTAEEWMSLWTILSQLPVLP